MALTKFMIPPDQSGYSVNDGQEALSTKLDGGASRFRRDVLNAARLVNVQWTLSKEEFQYFRAFYRSVTASGSLPFLIDLHLDDQEITEHTVHFMPNSVALNRVVATDNFTVGAQLEAVPNVADADYDQAIVDLFNEYGNLTNAGDLLDQLEILTNIDFPGSLI